MTSLFTLFLFVTFFLGRSWSKSTRLELTKAERHKQITSYGPSFDLYDVIRQRRKRQNGVNSTTSVAPKSLSSVTYSWSSWQPRAAVTCNASGAMFWSRDVACAASGRAQLQQTRKCEVKVGSVGKSVPGVRCGSGSARTVSCSTQNLCGAWGPVKISPVCNNTTCRHGPMIIENGTRGVYKTRKCDSTKVQVHENCTVVMYIRGRSVTGGGAGGEGFNPINPNPQPPSDNDAMSSSTKIIAFSTAGVVMVALLGFAGTRLSRTVKFAPLAHSRDRTHSSSVEANDIQYTSINQGSNLASPRVLVVNQPGGQPIRRQQHGRRMAPPLSNLSVIREEEVDDVFEDDHVSEHNSDVSYDDVTLDNASDTDNYDVTVKTRSDCEEALDYMDDVITQIEEDNDEFDHDVIPAREFRHSANSNLLSEYGWNPRDHSSDNLPITIEKLKDGSGEGFLSASALSLASASFLLPGSPLTKKHLTSSLSSSFLTDDVVSVTGSLTSTSSLKDVKRVPSRLVALKHFASMPDMTKAVRNIPDVDEVLAGSIEWRQT